MVNISGIEDMLNSMNIHTEHLDIFYFLVKENIIILNNEIDELNEYEYTFNNDHNKKIYNTEDYHDWITYIKDISFNYKRYYISNQKHRELVWNI